LITDGQGNTYQTIIYDPHGGILADIKNGTYDERAKFNGGELDQESGQYHTGARNNDPNLNIWTSTEPKWRDYPHLSPYVVNLNNSINFIDPDGKQAVAAMGGLPRPGYCDYRATSDMRYVGFFFRHPNAAISIGQYTKGSINISTNAVRFATRGNILNGTRGQQDEGSENGAFRHALWQAEITSQFGSQIALEAGYTHEENPSANLSRRNFNSLAAADETVDLLNNIIGRSIGEQNAGKPMNELAGLVLEEFATNGLWTANQNDKGQWTISRTKLSSEKYNQLKEIFKGLDQYGRKPEEIKVPSNNTNTDKPYIGGRQPNL
jgi:RHS repeat-associated protein